MSRSHTRYKHNKKKRDLKRRHKNGWVDKQQKDETMKDAMWTAKRGKDNSDLNG